MFLETYFGIAFLLAPYLALKRPYWFLAFFLSYPSTVRLYAKLIEGHQFDTTLSVGSLTLRGADPCTAAMALAVLVCFVDMRRMQRLLDAKMGLVLLMAVFLTGKVLFAVYNGHVSHTISNPLGGGLIAALGEVRDELLPIFIPIYIAAYTEKSSIKDGLFTIVKIVCPIEIAMGIIWIAFKGLSFDLDPDLRYLGDGALIITLFAAYLMLTPAGRLSATHRTILGLVMIAFATFSNNRSQWLALLTGSFTFCGFYALGVGFARDAVKRMAVVLLGLCLVTGSIGFLASGAAQSLKSVSKIRERAWAFTDFQRDTTASWRYSIWLQRIKLVGDDWPWGRQLGDRREVYVDYHWVGAPNHNAFVTLYELGGVILCLLYAMFAFSYVTRLWKEIVLKSNNSSYDLSFLIFVTISFVAVHTYMVAYGMPLIGMMIYGLFVVHNTNAEQSS